MSFSLRGLSVLAYSNGFTLWLYQANLDDRRTVMNGDFFQDAGDMLAQGDLILVSTPGGCSLLSVLADGIGVRTLPLRQGVVS